MAASWLGQADAAVAQPPHHGCARSGGRRGSRDAGAGNFAPVSWGTIGGRTLLITLRSVERIAAKLHLDPLALMREK